MAPMGMRPESRGSIHIRAVDPAVHPAIKPNYLSDTLDQQVMVAGLRMGRKIAASPALSRLIKREATPGIHLQTDQELLSYAEQNGQPGYHPVGTCSMGRDRSSVVDPRLRVHGIEGLRVVDASIMPRLVSGNTNAPAIMIGEKAADMILADARQFSVA